MNNVLYLSLVFVFNCRSMKYVVVTVTAILKYFQSSSFLPHESAYTESKDDSNSKNIFDSNFSPTSFGYRMVPGGSG